MVYLPITHSRAELIRYAERVLAASDATGPFGRVEDERQRLALAAEILLSPATEPPVAGWLQAMHAVNVRVTLDDFCPCGEQAAQHLYSEREEATATHVYWQDRAHTQAVGRNRRQAQEQFPFALSVVILSACGARWEREREACRRVLAAIDAGEKLIPALARLFRVTPAAIRHSRQLPAALGQALPRVGAARRALRVLNGYEDTLPPLERTWRHVAHWASIADLIVRRTSSKLELFFPPTQRLEEAMLEVWGTPPAERRSLLRCLVRQLRQEGPGAWLRILRGQLPQPGTGGLGPLPVLSVQSATGWEARALVTSDAVEREGEAMAHCVGRYAREVVRGEAFVFALRGERADERATLVIRHRDYGDSPSYELEIAGPHNDPFPCSAMALVGEVVQAVLPERATVTF